MILSRGFSLPTVLPRNYSYES